MPPPSLAPGRPSPPRPSRTDANPSSSPLRHPACLQHRSLSNPPCQSPSRESHQPLEHESANGHAESRLASELGLPVPRVRRLLARCPSLAAADLSANLSAVRRLGARPGALRRMAERSPELLVAPLASWVDFLTSYGVVRREVLGLLDRAPGAVAGNSILGAGRAILRMKGLGLTDRAIASQVLPRWPELLARDAEAEMGPVIDRLGELLPDQRRVREVICRSPGFLRFDVEERLGPTLAFLEQGVGLDEAEVRQVAAACLSVLLCDAERCLKPKVAFLASLGLDAGEVKAVFTANPQIVEFTDSNLRRKWHFLVHKMDGGTADVLSFPAYFSKSLLREIGPRHGYVSSHCTHGSVSSCFFTARGSIDLSELLGCSDTSFCTKVECSEREFEAFQKKWVNEAGLKWSGVMPIVL